MAGYRVVTAADLEHLAQAIFASAGTPDAIAHHVARHLVRANLSGHDSHGVLRIPQYVQFIDDGMIHPAAEPRISRELGATALLSAERGFGQYSTSVALDLAIGKAGEFGVGLVMVRQGNHIGRVGEYTEAAARRGFAAQVFGGTAGAGVRPAAPFGAAGTAFGTNPFSVGVPTSGTDPVLIDFATTVLAEGKLRIYRVKQEELPPDVIVDGAGNPSVDVEDFYSRGGMLKPIAAHKGLRPLAGDGAARWAGGHRRGQSLVQRYSAPAAPRKAGVIAPGASSCWSSIRVPLAMRIPTAKPCRGRSARSRRHRRRPASRKC